MIPMEQDVTDPWLWLLDFMDRKPELVILETDIPFALTEEQKVLLDQRNAKIVKRLNAKTDMLSIAGWANWKRADAEEWKNTNIDTPLKNARTRLSATQTLNITVFKEAITVLLNILDKIMAMLWAIVQMVIALRDDRYP